MKLDRKGFTLIELLVTIVIIGLIVGFSTYGIIMVVNNSKEKVNVINENNIKEAARIYSNEASSDSWKKADDYDNFCVTVGELMNKGLLDKNAKINETEIERSTYVIVKRNKVTMAVEKEEIVSNTVGDKNNEICTGQTVGEGENVTAPIIDSSSSYTDKIVVNFTPGSATYQGNESTTTYKCLYGESSSNINREGSIVGNSCFIDNLKNNKDYYIYIYMNTDHGSSTLADGPNNYKTFDFKKPSINYSGNIATIKYDDSNVEYPSHYFKSSVLGTSDLSVEKCQLNSGVFTCSYSTKNIEKDIWYKVGNTEVKITYPESDNDIKINASIYDDSNNHADIEKEFIKHTIRFYKNSADSIDGSTSEYIEKSCIGTADKNGIASCSITSPTIKRNGYTIVGFNISSTDTSSSWNVNTAKNVTGSATYYAITKANTYKISYTLNGGTKGTNAPTNGTYDSVLTISNPTKTVKVTGNANGTGATVGSATSKAQTFAGWTASGLNTSTAYYGTSSSSVTTKWSSSLTKVKAQYFKNLTAISGSTVTLTANWTAVALSLPTVTKTGYTCNWNTKSDGSGISYASGASYTPSIDGVTSITMYARCTVNSYKISYTLNGGTKGSSAPTTGNYDSVLTISNPTKTVKVTGNANGTGATVGSSTSKAQTFAGWTASGLNTSTAYYGASSSSVTTKWSSSSTKVTAQYFKNLTATGGTVTLTANWTAVAFSLPTVTKTGYTCNWNTKSDGSGISYASGASYTPSIDGGTSITMYARCTANTYTISYDANGGSGAPDSQTKTYGITLTLSDTIPSKVGYIFDGWSTSSTATSATYKAGDSYSVNASVKLYAVWKAKTLTVTFNKNDGSGSTVTQTFTYGVSGNKFGYNTDGTAKWGTSGQFGSWDRTGYELLGWSTTSTATSATYSVYSGVTDSWINSKSPSITLYAVWKDKASPTCKLSATAGSTTITAKASDNSGSLAYHGWSSSYSGSNSTSKTVDAIGIVRYYVKDAAGNKGSCSVAITGTTKSYTKTTKTCNITSKTCRKSAGTKTVGFSIKTYNSNNLCSNSCSSNYNGGVCVAEECQYCPSGCTRITSGCSCPSCTSGSLSNGYCYLYKQSSCPSGWTVSGSNYGFTDSSSSSTGCVVGSSFTCNSSNANSSYVSNCTLNSTSCPSGYTKLSDSYCYSSNNNSNIDTSATYVLRSYKNSNYVMDVENMGKENESNVLLWSYNGGTNQQWKFQKTSSGYYNILAKDSGRCLDIYQGDLSVEDGKNIQIYDCGTGAHQQWLAVYNSDGSYTFKSAASSTFSLDITGEIMEDGTNIEMYTSNNTNAQKWILEKIG